MLTLLVDGNSIAHWKFWGTPLEHDGVREVGMIRAFGRFLEHAADRFEADRTVVAFDGPRNWRFEILPSYKMHRPPTKPVLAEQLERLPGCVLAAEVLQRDGMEADDLIAEQVRNEQASEIMIVSLDKDLLQLVDNLACVSAWDPRRNQVYTENEVFERFGVSAHRLPEWLALVGDASDGVPGVPGWGKKYATLGVQASIDRHHLVDRARAGDLPVSSRLQKNLIGFVEHFERSFRLINLLG